jgi:hypothetical protein
MSRRRASVGAQSGGEGDVPRLADVIVKAGRVYSMNERRDVWL